MKPSAHIQAKIDLLPESPGVYMYYNAAGEVIYVGKAKKLRRRVRSYFNREHAVDRTNMLVRSIADLRYIVVPTEEDALHLENSLIKENNPRYNVLLKDDKTYPWIVVTNELYPRVFVTRTIEKGRGRYYGPYTNVTMVYTLIELLRELFPLRTCLHQITGDSIARHRHRLCLQYHIKNCRGCCIGEITPEEYGDYIDKVRHILSGDLTPVTRLLTEEMTRCAEKLQFEEAQALKEKLQLLDRYRAKSVIVSTSVHNVDVLGFVRERSHAAVNYMHVSNGSITKSLTLDYKVSDADTDAEVLSLAIAEVRSRFPLKVSEIVVPFEPDTQFSEPTFVPQRGDKRKLLKISEENARRYLLDRQKQADKLNPEQRVTRILTTMKSDFRLSTLPRHIECFDNSNIQGTNPVASCVVFRDAKPSKKDYRHFNIESVVGPDDFASMKEVLTRRYTRLIEQGEELPQLVVVDGGKGQLSAAVEAFDEMGIRGQVALIGIAKRLEEIYFPGDSIPLYLNKDSESLRVIQHLRDEAHRFGITHHRSRRSRGQTRSTLDNIKGVGEATRTALLKHFRSLKRIREASLEELTEVVGAAKARLVYDHVATTAAPDPNAVPTTTAPLSAH